jgi:hypothetical protein
MGGIRRAVGNVSGNLILHLSIQIDELQQAELVATNLPTGSQSFRKLVSNIRALITNRSDTIKIIVPCSTTDKNVFVLRWSRRYNSPVNSILFRSCFDGTYDIWMSLFISAIQSSQKSNINIKKYIMKVLLLLYRS